MIATEITALFCQQSSSSRLIWHWRALEIRKRRIKFELRTIHSSELQARLINIELTMQQIWDELTGRIDKLPESLIHYLIESCQDFTIMENF